MGKTPWEDPRTEKIDFKDGKKRKRRSLYNDESIHQDNTTNVNTYTYKNGSTKYIKQKLTVLKEK